MQSRQDEIVGLNVSDRETLLRQDLAQCVCDAVRLELLRYA